MKSTRKYHNQPKPLNYLDRTIIGAGLAAAAILLLPFLAMQFSDEVVWSLSDFIIAWILLFGAGLTYKLIAGKSGSIIYRSAIGAAVGTSLFLVWVNLAVGLIGSEGNPANLMYAGVLAVAFIGAIVVRLQAGGMARVMMVTAAAQAITAIIALIAGIHLSTDSSIFKILAVNGLFVAMWAGSSFLFWLAYRDKSTPNKS